MATLASNRKGFITGTSAGYYETALVQSTGTATDSATGNQNCIQYFNHQEEVVGVHLDL